MRHEKIIKDERGIIRIDVNMESSYNTVYWRVNTFLKAPRKKNEVWVENIATPAEILEAKLELWNLIKPS